DPGLELEVEVLERLAEREARVAQPRRQPPVVGGRGLLGDHPGQEIDEAPLLLARFVRQGGENLAAGATRGRAVLIRSALQRRPPTSASATYVADPPLVGFTAGIGRTG